MFRRALLLAVPAVVSLPAAALAVPRDEAPDVHCQDAGAADGAWVGARHGDVEQGLQLPVPGLGKPHLAIVCSYELTPQVEGGVAFGTGPLAGP